MRVWRSRRRRYWPRFGSAMRSWGAASGGARAKGSAPGSMRAARCSSTRRPGRPPCPRARCTCSPCLDGGERQRRQVRGGGGPRRFGISEQSAATPRTIIPGRELTRIPLLAQFADPDLPACAHTGTIGTMRRVRRQRDERDETREETAAVQPQAPASALLARADRERFERAFAADFTNVRVHRDSPRASGVHALTEREDIHVAPGVPAGDRLLAHELAHVVQQRSAGPTAPALAAELDADVAADNAVNGRPAQPQAAHQGSQAYEAWEHRALGDARGGAGRRIRLPNGIELTYGQIVALSGDFYRSPEALLAAPATELQQILAVMERERVEAGAGSTHAPTPDQVNANNAAYELATTGHDRQGYRIDTLGGDSDGTGGPHGEVREGEHVESRAPGAQAGFLDLASDNAAHFSPENIRNNWIPKHQLALDLARQAWQAPPPGALPTATAPGPAASAREGETPEPQAPRAPGRDTRPGVADAGVTAPDPERHEAEAWLTAAFADHYLTDAFASGHLISGSVGRTMCQAFYDANQSAIASACWECAIADGMPPDNAALVVMAFQSFLESRAASLLLKTVHDVYNREGLEVANALGQTWLTIGDAHLGGSPDTIAMAELAGLASRDAVQDVLDTGGTTRAERALDLIPDLARVAGGPFPPVPGVSDDPAARGCRRRPPLGHPRPAAPPNPPARRQRPLPDGQGQHPPQGHAEAPPGR